MIIPSAFLPFSPGMGEVLLILAAALVLFGADRLPGIARSMGRWLHQIRRVADDFHDQLLDVESMPSELTPSGGDNSVIAAPETDGDTHTGADVDADADAGTDAGADTGTDGDTDTDTDTDTGADADADTDEERGI